MHPSDLIVDWEEGAKPGGSVSPVSHGFGSPLALPTFPPGKLPSAALERAPHPALQPFHQVNRPATTSLRSHQRHAPTDGQPH